MSEVVKIFALGGLDERGKNLYVVEINDDIFVLDCGMKYPEKTLPGIDSVFADITYLKNNKDRVKAFIITHYHNDVIGALPYVLQDINAPVYCTTRTKFYIEETAKQNFVDISKAKFIEFSKDTSIKIAGRKVTLFSMTHSAGDNVGIAIHTENGNIVYSSDFIFDFSASKNYACNMSVLNKVASEGVLCLMCESEGCEVQGYTAPNHKITPSIEKYFRDKNRIIISLYTQSAYSITEVIFLARKYNRKLCLYNRSMQRIIKGLLQNKLIPSLDDILVDYSYISDHEDVIVLVNGVGQYAFRELIKLADGNPDKNFSIRPTDTIIIGTSPVPGLEVMAANASDALFSSGAKVVTISKKTVCSMHAHSEDIKMLLNILKPKYFMPVKGEYKSLLANAMLAVDLNMEFDYSNVIVYDNGMVAKFNDGKKDNMYNEIIETGNVYVDGLGVGDVENHVIITRQKMADNGVVILGATVSKSQRKVIAGPDVQMRGFIFLKDADNLVKDISTTFIDTLNEYLNTELQDLEECKNRIKEKIIFKIKKSTGKDPLIIPAVIEL